ncbi:MAG: pyruvate synthase subunit beta [Candidatus Diapherotrites archaeon]|nr:pyruvate synthase subunit beta [Candidatus Diapherotrites archaeon]
MSSEVISSGHSACAGCGEIIGERMVLEALGKDVIVCQATGCMEITTTPYPRTAFKVPWLHVTFENAASAASGIVEADRKLGRNTTVVAIGGDGGMMDIGVRALSGVMERGHDLMLVVTDNEAYMNTGIQRSSGTPKYAATTTTPAGSVVPGKREWKKSISRIAIAHGIPYVATASIGFPEDLVAKVKKAQGIKGPKLLHIYTPCPVGWGYDSSKTVYYAKKIVETGLWPLYEIENGKLTISQRPTFAPLEEYFTGQKRYKHIKPEHIKEVSERVKAGWKELEKQEKAGVDLMLLP